MLSYDDLVEHFSEFKAVFQKASHQPFTSVELLQVFRPDTPSFRDCLLGKHIPSTPYKGPIGKLLFRNMEAAYIFSISADGTVNCKNTHTYSKQPIDKWIRLISRWLSASCAPLRQIKRNELIKMELVAASIYKQHQFATHSFE